MVFINVATENEQVVPWKIGKEKKARLKLLINYLSSNDGILVYMFINKSAQYSCSTQEKCYVNNTEANGCLDKYLNEEY